MFRVVGLSAAFGAALVAAPARAADCGAMPAAPGGLLGDPPRHAVHHHAGVGAHPARVLAHASAPRGLPVATVRSVACGHPGMLAGGPLLSPLPAGPAGPLGPETPASPWTQGSPFSGARIGNGFSPAGLAGAPALSGLPPASKLIPTAIPASPIVLARLPDMMPPLGPDAFPPGPTPNTPVPGGPGDAPTPVPAPAAFWILGMPLAARIVRTIRKGRPFRD